MSDFPSTWALSTLDQIADWGSGGTPKAGDGRYYGGDIPWAVIGDLSDGPVDTTASSITSLGLENSSAKMVPTDTLLVAMYGSIGKLGITTRAMATNQAIAFARPRSGIDLKYLFYYLLSQRRQLSRAGKGATQQNISQSVLKPWPMPLAPTAEQDRIVAAIEEQFSRLEVAEALLLRSKARFEGLRSSVITSLTEGDWPRLPWTKVGRSQNGRAFPSRDYADEGVRLLRPGNLDASGRVVWTEKNTRRLPTNYEEEFPSYVVGPNELVMNLTAQSLKDEFLGRVCLTGPDEHSLLNQRIARLTALDADPRFLLFVFKARPFRRFVGSLNKGSLIQHMFTSQIAEFAVPLPALDEQRGIVAEIDLQLSLIDSLTTQVERALERCTALRRAILQRAFTGRLVPQDPSDEPASILLNQITSERAAANDHKPTRARQRRRKATA